MESEVGNPNKVRCPRVVIDGRSRIKKGSNAASAVTHKTKYRHYT